MCCKDLGADRVVAWPTAEIAVMGAEGAAEIVFRREIDAAEDKAGRRKELVDEYRETFPTPTSRRAGGLWMTSSIPPKPENIWRMRFNRCTPNGSCVLRKNMG